jgi:hypothetical protein
MDRAYLNEQSKHYSRFVFTKIDDDVGHFLLVTHGSFDESCGHASATVRALAWFVVTFRISRSGVFTAYWSGASSAFAALPFVSERAEDHPKWLTLAFSRQSTRRLKNPASSASLSQIRSNCSCQLEKTE